MRESIKKYITGGKDLYRKVMAPEKEEKSSNFSSKEDKSRHWAVALARELLIVALVVGGIALGLYLVCGAWPAIVTIESESMVPNMNIGDLVVVVAPDRFGTLQSWQEGKNTSYMKYGDYGDVIIYQPNGASAGFPIPLLSRGVHPIIHRAIQYTGPGPVGEIKGKAFVDKNGQEYIAPHEGYITWGDNNPVPDQLAWYTDYRGLGPLEPVKKEWIVGKALFAIPLVGLIPLNIVPVAIIIIIAMFAWEWYSGRRKEQKDESKKGRR